jgi:hypothetical protein
VLTEGLRRAGTRRRMAGDKGQAAEMIGARGEGRRRGAPRCWAPWIASGGSCGGAAGVKKACGPPEVSNCGGGQCSPEAVLGEIPANERAGFAGEGLRSSQMMRRSCCGAQLGRGCGGAASPRRCRRGDAAEQESGGARAQGGCHG